MLGEVNVEEESVGGVSVVGWGKVSGREVNVFDWREDNPGTHLEAVELEDVLPTAS